MTKSTEITNRKRLIFMPENNEKDKYLSGTFCFKPQKNKSIYHH